MKKSIPVSARLLAVLLVLALALGMFPVGVIAETPSEGNQEQGETTVAVIGDESYTSLAAAVEAAEDGATIELTGDSVGTGIVIDKSLTIDLSGCTYTVGSDPVGSAGTETLGFQILKDHAVKLMNGTVNTNTDAVKMLVQNYADLTVTNVLLDGTGSTTMQYVLSNNCGDVTLDGSTGIKAGEGVIAFDVYDYSSGGYDYPSVTVNTTGTIAGDVEVSPKGVSLAVENGIFNGALVVLGENGALEDATITINGGAFTADVSAYLAEGLSQVAYGNVVSGPVAMIGDAGYDSLKAAVEAAASGDTVTLQCDAVGSGVVIDKDITIDFGGNTYTVSCEPVGSAGTQTLGFQILKGHDVTLRNGTFRTNTDAVKMLVQNYTNLTVTNMTLDGTGSTTMQYVLSNNCGEVTVGGDTSILAPEGAVALDAYDYSSGGYDLPVVTVDTEGTVIGKIEVSEGVTLEVLGGTFSADVSAYLPEGSNLTQNADGSVGLKPAAKIGDAEYTTLAAALAAADSGDEIVLQYSTVGEGLVIDKNVTIDFGGFTYTVNSTVGSAGTETLGLQILKGHDVTLRNGTINTNTDAVKMLVQNYTNLTVTDMTLDGTGSTTMQYVLSNNCGEVTVDGETDIVAPEGAVALDAYNYSVGGYTVPHVTVDTTGDITGKIEVSTVEGETLLNVKNGNFTVDVSAWLAEGFTCTNEGGVYDVIPAELSIGFEEPKSVGELDGKTYVVSGSEITVTVTDGSGILGLSESTDITVKDADGKDVAFTKAEDESGHKWVLTVKVPDAGLNGLVVTATDNFNPERTVESKLETVYAVDTIAPEIGVDVVTAEGVTANSVNGVDYYNDGVAYVITVTDLLIEAEGIKISYTLNGERLVGEAVLNEETGAYVCTVELEDGDKIENVSVAATDLSTNLAEKTDCPTVVVDTTAPTAELSVEGVSGVVTKDEKTFLVVDGVEESNTVTVTVKVTDTNLDTAALAEAGWTEKDGSWCRSFEVTVAKDQTGSFEYDFAAADLAGNLLTDVLNWSANAGEGVIATALTVKPDENGLYSGKLYVDCRQPGNGAAEAAPVLNITSVTAAVGTVMSGENEIELFNGAAEFEFEVNDNSSTDANSGVKSVEVSVADNLDGSFLSCETTQNGDTYTASVNLNGENETNNAVLSIKVEDYAGNTYTYTKTFAVDNKAPEVELAYDNNEVSNGQYFDADRILTITAKDINFGASLVEITGTGVVQGEGWTQVEGTDTYTCQVKFAEGEHTFGISVTDKAGNVSVDDDAFIIDETAPVVKIEKKTAEGAYVRSNEEIGYYRNVVEYTVTVTDTYLQDAAVQVAYNNGAFEPVEAQPSSDAGQKVFTFKVEDGQLLTGISIDAVDLAGNTPDGVNVTDADRTSFKEEDGVWNYNSEAVAVDKTAPEVKVEKAVIGNGYKQSDNGYDYYDAYGVTYTVTISDAFLNAGVGTAQMLVKWESGKTETQSIDAVENNGPDVDTYTFTVTVNDGEGVASADEILEMIALTVSDNAGNVAQEVTVTDADGLTDFAVNEDGTWEYTGNKVVVDGTAPTVEVRKEVVNGSYRNKCDAYDYYDASEILYTVTVKDSFLNIGDGVAMVKVTYWNGTVMVLDINAAELSDGVEVVSNDPGAVMDEYTFTFTVAEGNPLTGIEIIVKDNEGHGPDEINVMDGDDVTPFAQVMDENDTWTGVWEYVGRAVAIDTAEPVVKVEKVINEEGVSVQTADGYDYYRAGSVTYTVTVTDAYLTPGVGTAIVSLLWGNSEDNQISELLDITAVPNRFSIEQAIVAGPEVDTYKFIFTVEDGDGAAIAAEILNKISINVLDNAKHAVCAEIEVEDVDDLTDFEDPDGDGIWEYKGNMVVVDNTAPVVTVKKDINGAYTHQSDDCYDYYKASGVTYKVTVTDSYLNVGVGKAVVTLTYWDGTTVTMDIDGNAGGYLTKNEVGVGADLDQYEFTFTVAAGETLKGIQIDVADNAGNTPEQILCEDEQGLTEFQDEVKNANDEIVTDGIWDYCGKMVVVDNTAPVVTVEKDVNGAYAQSDAHYDYYKAEGVTYTVTVTDTYLNIGVGKAAVTLTYWDGTTKSVSCDAAAVDGPGADKYVFTFTVAEGETLKGIEIDVADNAGNTPERILCEDEQGLTKFRDADKDGNTDGIWNYNGKTVVVDHSAPVVKVFKNNSKGIKGIYAQSDDSFDYYNSANVEFQIGIADIYLNNGIGSIEVTLTYWDGTTVTMDIGDNAGSYLTKNKSNAGPTLDQYVFTFNVEEGKPLTGITIKVTDNAGNVSQTVSQISDADNRTSFAWKNDSLTYTGLAVAVDKTVPSVEIEKTVEKESSFIQNAYGYDYYDGNVTYTITVKDAYLTAGYGQAMVELLWNGGASETLDIAADQLHTGIVENVVAGPDEDTYIFTFTVADGDGAANANEILQSILLAFEDNAHNRVTAEIVAADQTAFADSNNDGVLEYTGQMVVSDKTAPYVGVEKVVVEGAYSRSDSEFDYYDANGVKYIVTVTDEFLNIGVGKAVVTLNYWGTDGIETETLEISGSAAALSGIADRSALSDGVYAVSSDNGPEFDEYVIVFTVADGETLTGIQIDVADNSGNIPASIGVEDANGTTGFKLADGVWTYTGKKVVADNAPSRVVLKKTVNGTGGKFVQSYNGYDYYNAESVTYVIAVTDTYLSEEGHATVTLTYWDGTTQVVTREDNVTAGPDLDMYTFTFTVEEGKVLTGISIDVEDDAGNRPMEIIVSDANEKTAFGDTNGIWNYTGNGVVVDHTDPVIKLSFSDNVDKLYLRNGRVYVRLKKPINVDSGVAATGGAETVTITVTATDKNMVVDADNLYGVKDFNNVGWTGRQRVNLTDTLTYTQSISVDPDDTGEFSFRLRVYDLAGNTIDNFVTTAVDEANNSYTLDLTNGVFGANITVDRRRSSALDDHQVPEITAVPDGSAHMTTTESGLDLFDGEFNYILTINELFGNVDSNSGLNTVTWTLSDGSTVVREATDTITYDGYQTSDTITVPVKFANGIGETNSVKLEVWATDNAGNIIPFTKEFAVDAKDPEVTLEYNVNDPLNDKYFNRVRTLTITVKDINFNPDTTTVIAETDGTEIPGTAWSEVSSDTYEKKIIFDREGDCTFEMVTTDRAGNVTGTNPVVGDLRNNEDAPYDFVYDWTKPQILVDIDGNAAATVGGIEYYNTVQNVTVTIDERNFNVAEVNKEDDGNPLPTDLSAWENNGYVHSYKLTYQEGNEHCVKVWYTDLAGNVGVGVLTSGVFTVDCAAPVISVDQPDMKPNEINVVPGDLDLSFTVTDALNNISVDTCTVDVTFLDSHLQSTTLKQDTDYTVTLDQSTDVWSINITLTNPANEKANDGIYTVTVSAWDHATNAADVTKVVYSLNRFGSTFRTDDDYTKSVLELDDGERAYVQKVEGNLVITELNPNKVFQSEEDANNPDLTEPNGSRITVSVNGETTVLTEGTEYTLTVLPESNSGDQRYEYVYTINSSVFEKDGRYDVYFYGVDEAGNINSNEANGGEVQNDKDGNATGTMSFIVDSQAPVVTVMGLDKSQYRNENHQFQINVSDNNPYELIVTIDGVALEAQPKMPEEVDNGKDWVAYDSASGNWIVNMASGEKERNVSIQVEDQAGNSLDEPKEYDVTINARWWILFINNELWVGCAIGGGVLLLALILFLIFKRKKKEKPEETAQA